MSPQNDSLLVPRDSNDKSERSQLARTLWLRSLLGDQNVGPEADELANFFQEVIYPKGSFLYRTGDPSEYLYFIVSGLITHGTQGRVEFRQSDALGFVDGVLSRPHRQDARVQEEAIVLRLSVDDWLEFLEEHFEYMRRLLLSRSSEMHPRALGFEDDDPETPAPQVNGDDAAAHLIHRLTTLQVCPPLHRASVQAIAQLARQGTEIQLQKGEARLLSDADIGIWVGLDGTVGLEIERNGELVCYEAGRGALLGGMNVIERLDSRFRMVAVTPARVLHLPTELVLDVMEDHNDLMRSFVAYIGTQVEHSNERGGRPFGHSEDRGLVPG